MKECLICQKEANKTGSHMIPHFLLKRIINENNSKKRGKEFGFEISASGLSSFFGRGISPESLEKTYGEEITDDRIKRNVMPFIEDYIFCNDCEIKLGEIESEYSKTLNKKELPNNNYCTIENSIIPFIFWISIVWRISISKDEDFKLEINEEKKLKEILFKYFYSDKEGFIKDELLRTISYKLLRVFNYSKNNPTVLICNLDLKAICFVIDEFVLVFSIKENEFRTGLSFFDEEFSLAEVNSVFNGEYIRSISYKLMDKFIENYCYNTLKNEQKLELNDFIDFLYKAFGNRGEVSVTIKDEIFSNIINDNLPIGKVFTESHKKDMILKVFKKNNFIN